MIWVWRSLFALWMLAGIAVLIWGRETAKLGIATFYARLHGQPDPTYEDVREDRSLSLNGDAA